MFLQSLALKLGVVAERDLAQACRDAYPKVHACHCHSVHSNLALPHAFCSLSDLSIPLNPQTQSGVLGRVIVCIVLSDA